MLLTERRESVVGTWRRVVLGREGQLDVFKRFGGTALMWDRDMGEQLFFAKVGIGIG